MTQRVGLLNGTNITYDKDLTAGLLATTNQGIIGTGFAITGSGASANVLPGKALIECTRTNGEKVMVFFENTANVVVDLTGTKKLYILVDQAKLDDGSSNALDGTGIGSIQTGASYPANNCVKIASVTSGVITDERFFMFAKSLRESIADGRDRADGTPKSYYSQISYPASSIVREFLPNGGGSGAYVGLGIVGESSYWFFVETHCWSESSVGIRQFAYGKNEVYCRISTSDTTWGAWSQIYPMSGASLISALNSVGLGPQRIPVVFAEASSVAGKAFSVESQAYAFTPTGEVAMGNTASNTKIAIPFYHSGLATTQLKLYLRKVLAPTDNVTVRIETDSSDAPSGTLAHANATFSVTGASLTTSHAVITGTMTSWTATRGTKLWIVLSRPNANDASNYYMLGTIPLDTRIFMGYKLFNASWSAKTAIGIYFESTACEKYVAILSSTVAGMTKIAGFADGVYSAGGTGYLSIGKTQSITGVTKSNYYSLSATSGDLQITPVSTLALGYCGEDGTLVLMDDVLNIPGYFYQNGIGDNTAFSGQQIRAQFYCKSNGIITGGVNFTGSFNSGGGTYYIGILRAGAWVQVTTGSRVFAGESVGVVVNGSGSGSNYVTFDWNVQFTPSF